MAAVRAVGAKHDEEEYGFAPSRAELSCPSWCASVRICSEGLYDGGSGICLLEKKPN
jgi:hypothetical protein